jgi:hypothetical protein
MLLSLGRTSLAFKQSGYSLFPAAGRASLPFGLIYLKNGVLTKNLTTVQRINMLLLATIELQ